MIICYFDIYTHIKIYNNDFHFSLKTNKSQTFFITY